MPLTQTKTSQGGLDTNKQSKNLLLIKDLSLPLVTTTTEVYLTNLKLLRVTMSLTSVTRSTPGQLVGFSVKQK